MWVFMNKNSDPRYLGIRKCSTYHFLEKHQKRCTVLALDAALQKGRFPVQWLEGAQEGKPEGGMLQNVVSERIRNGELAFQARMPFSSSDSAGINTWATLG